MAPAICQNRAGPGHADPGQGDQVRLGGRVKVDQGLGGDPGGSGVTPESAGICTVCRGRLSRPGPPEGHPVRYLGKECRSDPGNPIQLLQPPKRPPRTPVSNDTLCQ